MNLTIVINVCFNISLIRNNFEFSNDYDNDFQIRNINLGNIKNKVIFILLFIQRVMNKAK